jgi:phenylalanyl-tRNA synthetase beta chain
MRISLEWLSQYIDLSASSPESISAAFTSIGLEVEAQETMPELHESLVIAKIETATRHPNADRLQVCRVDIGTGSPVQIVCGAANARAGLYVIAALPGATLPNGMNIKAGNIRDVDSMGMLCSEEELGLAEKSAGILEWNQGTVGTRVRDLLGPADTILTLNVTPNRADCFSYRGLARDLSAKIGKPLLPMPEPKIHFADQAGSGAKFTVQIDDPDLCTVFAGLTVHGIKETCAPLWMKRRLRASGMRSVNLIVDISNYLMLESGQPNHPYDLDKIKGGRLRVKSAALGDHLTLLDQKNIELQLGDIIICDGEGPLGLAGIMGGRQAEVSTETHNIALEVAHFDPVRIRKTAKRLILHSEASFRFERGVDASQAETNAWRFAQILHDIYVKDFHISAQDVRYPSIQAGLQVTGNLEFPPRRIAMRIPRLRDLLGRADMTRKNVLDVFDRLGFKYLDDNEQRIVFEVPSWRQDIEREADLIEEFARIDGYDKIPNTMPNISMGTNKEAAYLPFISGLKRAMAHAGFCETITFPFAGLKNYQAMGIHETHNLLPRVEIANPINEHEPFLKTLLISGLLEAVLKNRNRGVQGARLFEYGRAYFPAIATKASVPAAFSSWLGAGPSIHLSAKAQSETMRPVEKHRLACVIDQPFLPKSWHGMEQQADFHTMKSLIHSVMSHLGILQATWRLLNKDEAELLPFMNPKLSAAMILNDSAVGFLGSLHPKAAQDLGFGLKEIPLVFECDSELLFRHGKDQAIEVERKSFKFPASYRDLAFLVASTREHQAIHQCLKGTPSVKYLWKWELFDIYQGESLSPGKKSMAYRFFFRSMEKTLSDKEVDLDMQTIQKHLEQQLGIEARL